MNTISNNLKTSSLYTQSTEQTNNIEEQSKVKHHKKKMEDCVDISKEGLQFLNNSTQSTSSNPAKDALDNLVSSGTITQEQEDAITSAFESSRKSSESQLTYNNSNKSANPIANLVSSGTITKDQANSIQNALKASRNGDTPPPPPPMGNNSPGKNALDSLVSSGTITQDQENTIDSALKSAFESSVQSDDNSSKNDPDSIAKNALDSLVSSGTITSDLENTILNALSAANSENADSSLI